MRLPRISIVTSTYNRAEMLRRAIESVWAQDFQEWEMCVVGDCTPDHTGEVVASYNDPRLRFHNLAEKSPEGSHGAIAKNYGIQQMARAPYIAYLDDDDAYKLNFLSTMMGYLAEHPDAALLYCRAMYRDKKTGKQIWGNPFQRFLHGYSREKLQRYNFIDTDCVIHKKAAIDEVGGWNPDFYFDDYELWLRISEKYDFHYLNEVLVEKYGDETPFFIRLFTKGLRILRHGRTNPLE
jgi:glycosyltransferase involved in cell wall biosynthesis